MSTEGPTTSRRRAFCAAAVVALVAVLAACSSSSSKASSSTAAKTTSTASTKACVTDVAKVIARKATPKSTTAALRAALVSKLEAAASSSFKQAAAPGAIVGVRTPEGTWTKTYGVADPATNAPMTTDMHQRVGSVTKTFTGTLMLQLAEQGKLSLDDTIDKYVSGIPNGNRITLRQLADMTSGVASYTASTKFTDTYFAHPETVFTPDQLLAVGIAESPIFEPGAQFNYSNTNTILLGKVIEKVTGQPVETVFQQRILGPLGLTNTSWPGDSPAFPDPHPQGFTLQGVTATPDNPGNATFWNPAWGWTAGEMISNLADLLTYDRALGTGQGLLDPKTQTERLTSFPGPAGYGIAMGCTDGWIGHTGELPGFNTALFYDTHSDTSVVVEVNSDIASGKCPESPTLTDDPRVAVCSAPATRMYVALSTALGNTAHPPQSK
jgi:D-alanyl-D-alanine carboxypeptidase